MTISSSFICPQICGTDPPLCVSQLTRAYLDLASPSQESTSFNLRELAVYNRFYFDVKIPSLQPPLAALTVSTSQPLHVHRATPQFPGCAFLPVGGGARRVLRTPTPEPMPAGSWPRKRRQMSLEALDSRIPSSLCVPASYLSFHPRLTGVSPTKPQPPRPPATTP